MTPTPPRTHTLFILLALATVLLYLGASYAGGYLGFPLDDAWIHQTYARSLALRGEFAFVSGQPSAGSTSPLWSAWLAIGYALRLPYLLWTYALGAALLGLTAWLVYRLVLDLWPGRTTAALAAGIFAALEWHLGWAAVSGMETLLFTTLVLAAFVIPPRRAGWLGVIVGLSVIARPDGLTLLPFALARVWLEQAPAHRRSAPLLPWVMCLLGFGAAFAPYLLFNRWMGGAFWPNTFYAKQAEYAVYRQLPLFARLVVRCFPPRPCEPGVMTAPLVGAQALLVPGIALAAWHSGRAKQWGALLPLGWAAAFVAAYAIRLPVTYQHGRYLIPVIPVLIVAGTGGLAAGLRPRAPGLLARVISRAWMAATGLVLLAFWLIGARAYRQDVRIIESEMAAAARWVSDHTPPEALVAAHDIGALGYFGGREILDMAGLVSPEVIPFIRDEPRLRDWLNRSGAEYLMTFPDWYPGLAAGPEAVEVFRTGAPYSPAAGGTNMAVYRWSQTPP